MQCNANAIIYMTVVRRAAVKQKRELVLFYFYFSFIAVVRAAQFPHFQNRGAACVYSYCWNVTYLLA